MSEDRSQDRIERSHINERNTNDDEVHIKWGPHSVWTKCPQCLAEMNTRTYTKPGLFTHGVSLILCGLWLCPFAVIPYCCQGTKDVLHFCNACGAYIGAYESQPCNK